MDCNYAINNPSSCGSSSAGAGENTNSRKEKMKKSGGCNGGGKRSKGVMKLSTDPQSVAARERRHRISDRFKILQSLVPGGTKMDTVSMLDEAIHYVKFLKTQIWLHQTMINFVDYDDPSAATAAAAAMYIQSASSSSLPLEQNHDNMIMYPQNEGLDGVEMEEPFLPQLDPNSFPAGEDQFMCSYDAYMNF